MFCDNFWTDCYKWDDIAVLIDTFELLCMEVEGKKVLGLLFIEVPIIFKFDYQTKEVEKKDADMILKIGRNRLQLPIDRGSGRYWMFIYKTIKT